MAGEDLLGITTGMILGLIHPGMVRLGALAGEAAGVVFTQVGVILGITAITDLAGAGEAVVTGEVAGAIIITIITMLLLITIAVVETEHQATEPVAAIEVQLTVRRGTGPVVARVVDVAHL